MNYNKDLYNTMSVMSRKTEIPNLIGTIFYNRVDESDMEYGKYPGEIIERRKTNGLDKKEDIRAMALLLASYDDFPETLIQKKQYTDFISFLADYPDPYVKIMYCYIKGYDFATHIINDDLKLFSLCFFKNENEFIKYLNNTDLPADICSCDISDVAVACTFAAYKYKKCGVFGKWKSFFSNIGKLYSSVAKDSNRFMSMYNMKYHELLYLNIAVLDHVGADPLYNHDSLLYKSSPRKYYNLLITYFEQLFMKDSIITHEEIVFCEKLLSANAQPSIHIKQYRCFMCMLFDNEFYFSRIPERIKKVENQALYLYFYRKYVPYSTIYVFDFQKHKNVMKELWNICSTYEDVENNKTYIKHIRFDIANSINADSKEAAEECMQWFDSIGFKPQFDDFYEKYIDKFLDYEIFDLEEMYKEHAAYISKYCSSWPTLKAIDFYKKHNMSGRTYSRIKSDLNLELGRYNVSSEIIRKMLDAEEEYIFCFKNKQYKEYIESVLSDKVMWQYYPFEERKSLYFELLNSEYVSQWEWLSASYLEKIYYSETEYQEMQNKREAKRKAADKKKELQNYEEKFAEQSAGNRFWYAFNRRVPFYDLSDALKEFLFQKLKQAPFKVKENEITYAWDAIKGMYNLKMITFDESKKMFQKLEIMEENSNDNN